MKGVVIRIKDKKLLREGEKIRLDPEGPLYEVERVTSCSALLRRQERKVVEIPGKDPFEATRGERIHVAPTAFVIREVK
jgi:hypothetical protein